MCISLKFDYGKFVVANLFFQKSSKKTFGGGVGLTPLEKEGLKDCLYHENHVLTTVLANGYQISCASTE